MGWADEKAQQIAECTDFFKRRRTIAQALRDVQRETAEECATTIEDFDPSLAAAIRARFNLEPK